MITRRRSLATALLLAAVAAPSGGQSTVGIAPHTIVMRGDVLAATRARVAAHDPQLAAAVARLRRDADKALRAPIVAVTDKKSLLPPSGDKHDYFSLSPYWWPDPSKPDGLPYIRRDGETNPESKRDLDQPRVATMGENVRTLAVAYYLLGDERYARRAGEQLRAWFLDSATRMNPHLRFSQLVRGNPKERGSGIIDTRWFIDAVDASTLLEGSPGWSSADRTALQRWMGQYLDWLRTSKNGQDEHKAPNNHGSWYAAQTAALAMYTGDTALVRQIATDAKARIGWQIMADGQQPIELERTRSMHYSAFNAEALTRLAELARPVGVDLWHYEAPNGGSLAKTIDNLAKYLPNPAQWPGKQLDPIDPDLVLILLRRAQIAYGDARYAPTIARLDQTMAREDRSELLYPDPAR